MGDVGKRPTFFFSPNEVSQFIKFGNEDIVAAGACKRRVRKDQVSGKMSCSIAIAEIIGDDVPAGIIPCANDQFYPERVS